MVKEVNSDYLLWKRIKAGETQAFHDLYLLYADILFSFGTIYSKDHELIRDCIHDLFFELYKYRKNLADNDHIRNYLFKSLKRKIQTAVSRKLSLVYSAKLPEENDKAQSTDQDMLDEQENRLERIKKAIEELPERQQEILNLRFQLDLSYPEIAKILDISIESIRTSVYRSVKTIRQQFKTGDISITLLHVGLFLRKKRDFGMQKNNTR